MSARLAYTLKDAAEATGLSASYFDQAIRAGKLRAKRSSKDADNRPTGRVVILAADLEKFLSEMADA